MRRILPAKDATYRGWPAGAHVIDEGGAMFAKRAIYGGPDPADAGTDGPVIRLTGDARFAKVVIRRGRHDPHARPAVLSVR